MPQSWLSKLLFLSNDGRSNKRTPPARCIAILCFTMIALALISLTVVLHVDSTSAYNVTRDPLSEVEFVPTELIPTNLNFARFNSTNATLGTNTTQNQALDCLGLGKTIARQLQWFFQSKANGSKALDVRFYLTSTRVPRRVVVLPGDQFGLEWTDFKIHRKTFLIVHGFLSHSDEQWIAEMERALHLLGDVNVIVVDWSAGGNTWNYLKAALNTRIVGYRIAKFLGQVVNFTIAEQGPDTSNWGTLHLIGHSLGAHICGFAAKEMKKFKIQWLIDRITGLDPAQPCFKAGDLEMQLDVSDAPFVDIIHTNGRYLSRFGLGLPHPLGDMDFYPNGGKSQPGCVSSRRSYYNFLPIPNKAIETAICSHGRAYHYFTESIISAVTRNCTFWGHRWDLKLKSAIQIIGDTCDTTLNCVEMGINADRYSLRGTFLVITSNSTPFCEMMEGEEEEIIDHMRSDYPNGRKK